MKNLLAGLVALPLFFATPSCGTLNELLDVPAAAVGDVGGAVDALTPGEQAVVDTTTGLATTGGTLVGGPAGGAAAGALATLLATWLIKRRRKVEG